MLKLPRDSLPARRDPLSGMETPIPCSREDRDVSALSTRTDKPTRRGFAISMGHDPAILVSANKDLHVVLLNMLG